MSTTIDSLQIEIQSNSTNAATGIDALAKALKKLNKNSDINNAVTSLNNLRKSLHAFVNMPSCASKIESLASSMQKLKKVGNIDIGSSLSSVKSTMESLGAINVDGVAPQIEKIAGALAPLNNVKGSGFNAMMNGLQKLDSVVDGLDSATIDRFVAKIKELDEKLGPVSKKLVAIGNAFKAVDSKALTASGGLSVFGGKVNTTTLNLQSMINVAKNAWASLQPVINLLKKTISQAIEWDGIAARFGRGFGDQANEVYSWIQRLNKEMGINTQQFMQYSSTYATMLTGFGVASKDASKMALGYMELTYDIWAGYNDIYKSMDDAAAAVRSAIAGEVEPVRKAGFTIIESTLEQTAANHGLKVSLEKATEAQKSYLRYLALTDQAKAQGLVGAYAKELNTAEGLMRTFTQQLKSLAQTFGSVFLPALVKVMPWVQAFIDLLNDAILRVAAFFGIDIQKVDFGGASGLDGVADSANNAASAVGGTTAALKELKNATIGIDELNTISPSSSGSGGSAGGAGGGFDGLDIGSLWDESIFNNIQFEVDKIKDQLRVALSGIEAVVGGFSLAVGTILVTSGANIPLGLGLMAIGAVGLAHSVAANWDTMSDKLAKALTTVTSVVGGFLLAVGAFLAFSGVNVGLGAGLMVAGAASLGTAVAVNWKFLEGDFKNTLSTLTGIISGGLLAMGALFAFTGVDIPLGIALMAAGAVGLAATVALNWDTMPNEVKKTVANLTTIVSNAAIAIGAMLAFSGANVPLGMALMAAGAIGLVAAEQLNWESTNGEVKRTLDALTQLVSSAALGVGALLAFSGVNLPLGIALMAAGAVGLVSSTALNWDSIKTSVQNVIQSICDWVKQYGMLALGVILCLTGVGIPLGISLIKQGLGTETEGGSTVGNDLLETIKSKWAEIENWWNSKPALKEISTKVGDIKAKVSAAWFNAKSWWESAKGNLTAYTPSIGSILNRLSSVWGEAKNWWTTKKGQFSTYTPTIGSIVTRVSDAWTVAKNWWTNTKTAFSAYIPPIGSIKDKVSAAWTDAKKWWTDTKAALSTYTPSIGSIKDKVSSAWTAAKNWWTNSKTAFSTYTPSIGNIKSALETAWNTAKKWWNDHVKLTIPSLTFKVTYDSNVTGIKKSIVDALDLPGWPSLKFAKDGGIFDAGSLIWAGEAGAEIVANAGGGRTGVMNVDQMQEAVYQGVYAAVTASMRANGGNGGAQAVNVYLDGRQITATVEQRQRERGVSLMGNQVYNAY